LCKTDRCAGPEEGINLIREAAAQGADYVLTPEVSNMMQLNRKALFEYLRDQFPEVTVVNGDATRLGDILRQHGVEDVGTVISGLPMVTMPIEFQRAIVEQSFAALGDDGCMLQYSYSPVPPIRAKRLGVKAELVRYVVRNLPPATVWRFRRMNGHGEANGASAGGR
jgi:phospholipid N-methyltransferase